MIVVDVEHELVHDKNFRILLRVVEESLNASHVVTARFEFETKSDPRPCFRPILMSVSS